MGVEVFTRSNRPVPWGNLTAAPSNYLDPESIPESFVVRDPSHMKTDHINLLWRHWETQRSAKKKLVVFIKAKTSDLRGFGGGKKDKATLKKKSAYIEVDSGEELDSLAAAAAAAGSGIVPSTGHSKLAAETPAKVSANQVERFKFLGTLSTNQNFLDLVDAAKDLAGLSEYLVRNMIL